MKLLEIFASFMVILHIVCLHCPNPMLCTYLTCVFFLS